MYIDIKKISYYLYMLEREEIEEANKISTSAGEEAEQQEED